MLFYPVLVLKNKMSAQRVTVALAQMGQLGRLLPEQYLGEMVVVVSLYVAEFPLLLLMVKPTS